MKKVIKKIGTQRGVTFTISDMAIYEMEEGDILDLRDMIVIKKKGTKKR